jgi:hypothetical protein
MESVDFTQMKPRGREELLRFLVDARAFLDTTITKIAPGLEWLPRTGPGDKQAKTDSSTTKH